jgi:hypothetical protein
MSMPIPTPTASRALGALRLAIVLTAIAMLFALVLLIKETAYIFAGFMFVGPVLLGVAVLLLGWVIWSELRAKQVL